MRIRIRASFWGYLILISLLSSVYTCISVMASLLIHELSHYAACMATGDQIDLLELTPLGGIMTYKQGVVSSKGIKGVCIHSAGPLGNYAVLLLCSSQYVQSCSNPLFLRPFMTANAAMMLLNLLPALPLDGGHILFCLGYYFFPVYALSNSLSILGMAFGLVGCFLSIYGVLIHGFLNCSLLIISLHLICRANKHHHTLLAENIYTVVQERMMGKQEIRKLICYQIPADTALFELIPYLKDRVTIRFCVVQGSRMFEINEYTFCQALLSKPYAAIGQICMNSPQYQEKNMKNNEKPSFIP